MTGWIDRGVELWASSVAGREGTDAGAVHAGAGRGIGRSFPGRVAGRRAAQDGVDARGGARGSRALAAAGWRWWVVHLWVEQSFEFFAAAMDRLPADGYGDWSRASLAERTVYFELILIFLGGVLGTGHHLYWCGSHKPVGAPRQHVLVHRGALPLVLLVLDAIQHYRLIGAHKEFKYGLAYTYVINAAFWNFVGAGRLRRRNDQCPARQLL